MASKEQVDYIRKRSKEGAPANKIQREMQQRHMGMRRKRLLGYVREFKGRRAPTEPYKYVPTKYRVGRARFARQRRVAVYGAVNGESRRVQLSGDGKSLYQAVLLAYKHPPKKRFLTCGAGLITMNPRGMLDYGERWDERPEVQSG